MIQGVDVAHWQGEMDWYKCRGAGARFAYIRAGSCTDVGGACYKDHQFERNAGIAPDYLPSGFYWYFRPYHNPIDQANYFCDLIRAKRSKLPPACDLEVAGNLTPAQVTSAASKFCRQIFNRLDVWPILYSRGEWLNAHTCGDPIWDLVELWVARYANKLLPWGNPGESKLFKPLQFSTWRLWQKEADGNQKGRTFGAKSDSICIDYFNGDEDQFCLWAAMLKSNLVKVTRAVASLRAGPGNVDTAPVVGNTWRGRVWPVRGKSGDWIRVEGWIRAEDCEEI